HGLVDVVAQVAPRIFHPLPISHDGCASSTVGWVRESADEERSQRQLEVKLVPNEHGNPDSGVPGGAGRHPALGGVLDVGIESGVLGEDVWDARSLLLGEVELCPETFLDVE